MERSRLALAFGLALTVALLGLSPPQALAADAAPSDGEEIPSEATLPAVRVEATRLGDGQRELPLTTGTAEPSPAARARSRDGSELLDSIPGTAVLRNGPLTGIAQMHGLSNDRVRVLVDGMTITPVSLGGDSIAGTLVVEPRRVVLATEAAPRIAAKGGSSYDGSRGGYGAHDRIGVSSRTVGIVYGAGWQRGDTLRFPGGRVADTGFSGWRQDVDLATRSDLGLLSFDGGTGELDYAGTPALLMDVVQDSSRHAGMRWSRGFGFGELEARVFWHSIDHAMDNFSLRPLPAMGGMGRMESPAKSHDLGYRLGLSSRLRESSTLRVGAELHSSYFDSEIHDLDMGQEQDGIPDGRRLRFGSYVEWEERLSGRWLALVGVRNDTVSSRSGEVDRVFHPMSPMRAAALAADRHAYDAADRRKTDVDWEATALLRFEPATGQRYELGAARKVRAPSLLERYQWTPLSASAGMADGRLYVGNLDLEPETAYQAAVAGEWSGGGWKLRLAPFYTWVSGYIQGAPVAGRFDPSSGVPVLRYENFPNVHLYGVEASGEWRLHSHVMVRGFLSYVRGRNRSASDDLYRIMPLHGVADLDLDPGSVTLTPELEWAAPQHQVARFDGEKRSAGYAVVNLAATWRLAERLTLAGRVDNLFDHAYAVHTTGLNRVMGSDVAIGQRLPGAGRAAFVSLELAY